MQGKWEAHVEKMTLANQIDYLKDRIVELTYYHDTLSNPEIYHFDEQSAKILMVDRYNIPLDKVKEDLRNSVVDLNKLLKEKEKEFEEKFGESDE